MVVVLSVAVIPGLILSFVREHDAPASERHEARGRKVTEAIIADL